MLSQPAPGERETPPEWPAAGLPPSFGRSARAGDDGFPSPPGGHSEPPPSGSFGVPPPGRQDVTPPFYAPVGGGGEWPGALAAPPGRPAGPGPHDLPPQAPVPPQDLPSGPPADPLHRAAASPGQVPLSWPPWADPQGSPYPPSALSPPYPPVPGDPAAPAYGLVGPAGEVPSYGVPPQAPARPPAGPPPPGQPAAPAPGWQEAADSGSLSAEFLIPGRHTLPASGWRRVLYRASGGRVRVPESAGQRRREELVARARTPVAGGHHRVAVLSLKGGVGKTTTTIGLGATLASLRGDRVIAVDANPDRGTLSDKLRLETAATIRDLLNERDQIERYADVRAYTTQAPSRLEVLASDRDPTVSVAFGDRDYEDVARLLEHFYSVCVTDCGTGLLHSAMAGVLRLADQIVLVSSPSVDGARSASATLDWLGAHNYGSLARAAVVVLSMVRPRSKSTVDLGRLEQHFAARCRAVVRIPFDPHLEEGAEVDLSQLSHATADAYLQLAAEVGDGFAWPRPGRGDRA
jgi:MinD-like ATPase involved in chromosome partitioning or flagellar assembly